MPEVFQAVPRASRKFDGICWYFRWYLAKMPPKELAGTNNAHRYRDPQSQARRYPDKADRRQRHVIAD